MATAKVPLQPLGKIAMSCSGGGYRAASFHLGAMSYLQRLQYNGKPLLEHVRLLSTVSGGTITGIVYALQKQEGKSFEEIYAFLFSKLQAMDLTKVGITMLNPDAKWQNTHKHKNLINAFAEQYDKELTGGATFAALDVMKSHLEAVVFNSTEFTHAVDFRLKNRQWPYTGNFYLRVPPEAASEIKLADAMAASSCFPAGFEPIIWPDDFAHTAAPNINKLKAANTPVGLMDGGIYDNQGIDAMLSYKQYEDPNYFDLYIVSDVTSPYMKPYKAYGEKEKKGWMTLTVQGLVEKIETINKRVNTFSAIAIVLLLLLPLSWGYTNSIWTGVSVTLAVMVGLILCFKIFAVTKVLKLRKCLENFAKKKENNFYYQKLMALKIEELSVHRVAPLLMDRLNSLVSLLLNVFLKVVRRLNYRILYSNDNYAYRRLSNLIRQLTRADFEANQQRRGEKGPDPQLIKNSVLMSNYDKIVSKELGALADTCSSFGTTLWFTEGDQLNDMLQKLIALGQANMCYNMLWYLENVIYTTGNGYPDLPADTRTAIELVYNQCKTDWSHFNNDPMFLFTKLSINFSKKD